MQYKKMLDLDDIHNVIAYDLFTQMVKQSMYYNKYRAKLYHITYMLLVINTYYTNNL